MINNAYDNSAIEKISKVAREHKLDISGGIVRRSSSRFCLGVEHGDYNGTELFGVGTDRFIWLGYKPNNSKKFCLMSAGFPEDGVVEFEIDNIPEPKSIKDSWARFPCGVAWVLRKHGYNLTTGFDAVDFGNIPGGGMSRSASITLNLILSMLDANGLEAKDSLEIIDMAVEVENDYIGSPCGELDQIMILFAKEGMGTHYDPNTRKISYVPLGENATDFRIVGLDTGTKRPGLEKSTYKLRRNECDKFAQMLKNDGLISDRLADIKDEALYNKIMDKYSTSHPKLCQRMTYIYKAQKRFYEMMDAWKSGDIEKVGAIFRQDGIGLRDEYVISGAELESMCDITRTVDGVLGERMLGGGDKGAAGAIINACAEDALREAIGKAYPMSHPDFAEKFAVHICKIVDGISVFKDIL